jgi:predicted DNA-binding mobile mystery protein A
MDCTLVYALVPKTSLEDMVQQRARKLASHDLRRVAHTMKLEAQETSDADLEARIQDYIRNVLKDRDLWNEP